MRSYELVVVLRPSLKEDARKKFLDTLKGWFKDVKFAKEEDLGSKAFKYKIKGELTGHYFDFTLETEAAVPADLEKRLLDNEDILRHLVIRTK